MNGAADVITAADLAAGLGLAVLAALIVIVAAFAVAVVVAFTRKPHGIHHLSKVRDLTDDEYREGKQVTP